MALCSGGKSNPEDILLGSLEDKFDCQTQLVLSLSDSSSKRFFFAGGPLVLSSCVLFSNFCCFELSSFVQSSQASFAGGPLLWSSCLGGSPPSLGFLGLAGPGGFSTINHQKLNNFAEDLRTAQLCIVFHPCFRVPPNR